LTLANALLRFPLPCADEFHFTLRVILEMTATSPTKGLEGVVAATSRLSDVRGEAGQLIYCGYDINDLAGNVSYEEVVYLLHHNHLPNRSELNHFKNTLVGFRDLPKGVVNILRLFPKDTPPMHAIRTAVSALGCYDTTSDDDSMHAQRRKALRLVAQIPIITAYFHRFRQGLDVVASDPSLGEAANFLYLLNGEKPSGEMAATMDMCYVLHADHGMNASTFAARVTIATMSDMYSAITSAIGTLKGPLHGGANEGVIKMLQEIGSLDAVDGYIHDALAQKRKIMGIGHRVYKTLDPRAPHLKRMAQVSLGIPIDLFTPIFAIARTSGWTAQVIEQLADNRLIRPQSVYQGPTGLKVVPIDKR